MKKWKKIFGGILLIMAVVSLTNLFGLPAAGLSVLIGIIAFFAYKSVNGLTLQAAGLDLKAVGKDVSKSGMWLWLFMPLIMNALVILIAKLLLPEYVDHVVSRSASMLSISALPVLILQLLILALGEEIAWRGFFQKRLSDYLSIVPTLFISSALFSLGHLTTGTFVIVAYDLFFIFVNSLFYGVIFHKTNNVWMSAISHFIANLFAVIVLYFL